MHEEKRQDQKDEATSSCTDSPTFQGHVGATPSQPPLVLPGKALSVPVTAGVTANILISICRPQQYKLSLACALAHRDARHSTQAEKVCRGNHRHVQIASLERGSTKHGC